MRDLNYAILGFLYKKDKHGYVVFKEVSNQEGFGQIFRIKIGKLYSILNTLEENKYLSSHIKREGVKPPKKIFRITKTGYEAFEKWMENPVKHGRQIRSILLMKLFFSARYLEFNENRVLTTQIEECKNWLANINEHQKTSQQKNDFRYLVSEFRKSQIEASISWLGWCKRRSFNA